MRRRPHFRALAPVALVASIALGGAAACGASATSPERPLHRIAADGGFLGWKLGAPLSPDPARFEATDRAHQHTLRQEVTVGGRPANRVTFEIQDGILAAVTLSFFVDGKEPSTELLQWGETLCAPFTEQVDWHLPPPPGTPEPGETWDPAYLESADCGGDAHGVTYRIALERGWASDFHNANVTIRLAPLAR